MPQTTDKLQPITMQDFVFVSVGGQIALASMPALQTLIDTGAGGGGATTFLALTDVPDSFVASALVAVNPSGTAVEFITGVQVTNPATAPVLVQDYAAADPAAAGIVNPGVTYTRTNNTPDATQDITETRGSRSRLIRFNSAGELLSVAAWG